MASLGNLLYNMITRKHEICCLCFKIIEDEPVRLHDEVLVIEDESENTLKISDLMSSVLGYITFNSQISFFESFCKQCTDAAVNSYKFILMSKQNLEQLANALNSLESCLANTAEEMYSAKTLFLTIDTKNFNCQQFYNPNHTVSTSQALKRFQTLFEVKPEQKIKTENSIQKDVINKQTQRRKRYFYSVPMKTNDMLYDKNDRTNLQCKHCLKMYPSLSNLRNHFIRVHAPKKHKCSICDRKFGSIALVEAHKNESHCTVVCKECGKTFNNRHTLKMHEIGHHLKLVCQDCGRCYKSQTTFKKHIELNICSQKTRASPADAKFTCDYCNKKYTQKVSLRVHIQYEHGNYKGHECKWCKKKFWAQSRLKAHIVKHTQEKKFNCNMCGGKFVSKESLLYHTRTHTGEKPYKCSFCDSMFVSASRRADHTKRYHSDAIFQCPFCNIKYTTKVCLEKHLKTHEKSSNTSPANHQRIEENINTSEDEIYLEEDEYGN